MKKIAIILAAGKGVRMKSSLPKVFHSICGKPMLEYVINSALKAGFDRIFVVVGYKAKIIMDYFKKYPVSFVLQAKRLGTGHAVKQVEPYIKDESTVVVLSGDMPLIKTSTIKRLIDFHKKTKAAATVLTATLDNPANYGRIVKAENGEIKKIVEAKDASPKEKKIKEVNTGIYCFYSPVLFSSLKEIKRDNAQKEYYLTDVLEILVNKGMRVNTLKLKYTKEAMGVNTREELKSVENLILSRGK